MGLIARIKNWVDGEILTEADLDAEFDNITDNIVDATTSAKGLIMLEDSHASTSITKGACPKNVKEAYDLAATTNVVEDTTPQLGGNLDPNGHSIGRDKGGDIASASPLVIDTDGDYFDVTGTTGFAAMTVAANRHFFLQFDGILTMTHHATNLDLPGEANITTAVGDIGEFFSTGANTVQCVNYSPAVGNAKASTNSDITSMTGLDNDGIPVAKVSGAIETATLAAAVITNNHLIAGDGGSRGVQERTPIVNDNGEMINPSQPAFLAYNSITDVDTTGDSTAANVDFDTEVFDQGNNFAADVFTAPTTGKYLFSTSILLDDVVAAHDSGYLILVTSNRTIYGSYLNVGSITDSGGNCNLFTTILTDMDVNDTAYIQIVIGGHTKTVDIWGGATPRTFFSGALIC